MALSLWQQELLQIKLLTSGTHSCILVFQSDQKATCLVTTNLWMIVQASLHLPFSKKSTLASYHRVREAIAAGYLQFNWKEGKSNPADILSKQWEFGSIKPLLKPLVLWKGDTHELTRGVTECQLKRVVSLMDKGQTNNPNVTPSGHPIKFWGLLAVTASPVHITQQNFLIGPFSQN